AGSPISPTVGPPPPDGRGIVKVGLGRSSFAVAFAGLGLGLEEEPPVMLSSASLGRAAGGGGPRDGAPTPDIGGRGAAPAASILGASRDDMLGCEGEGGPGAGVGGRKRRVGWPSTALRRSRPRTTLPLFGSFCVGS